MSINEDYKPIRTNNYYKNLSINEYLNRIKPSLRDIIHDHKIQGEWNVHSRNKVIDYKTQEQWTIWSIMIILCSKDSNEICTMHTKSNNIEIMMGNEADEIIE